MTESSYDEICDRVNAAGVERLGQKIEAMEVRMNETEWKPYFDVDGNRVSLDELCRIEPSWSAKTIREKSEEIRELRRKVEEMEAKLIKGIEDESD